VKRPWLLSIGALGVLALATTLFEVVPAGATPPHSDQVITVTKTASDTGGPLAGAVFTLYKWAGSCDLSSAVATATTEASGKATFSLEGHHNYCVVETTAPSGYTLPATTKVVKIEDCTNSKADDPANVKVCDSGLGFVDTPIPTQTNNPTTTTTTAPPTAASGGTGGGTGGTGPIGGATTVHTGEPWAGSALYVGAGAGLGALLLGSGGLLRRRRRLTA
jgi:hypothetical protein